MPALSIAAGESSLAGARMTSAPRAVALDRPGAQWFDGHRMARPNLFDFATSELSQDAFLCWLIANAGHEEDAALHGVGRAFIAWLWSASRGQPVSPADVRLLDGPLCQVDHIDILFEAEVCGRRVVFVVEDKTDTSQHSGQLERYKQAVSGRASEIVLVYFKTGYHFDLDKEAANLGYAVIGLKEWVAFLKEQAVPSEVFRDYLSYANRLLEERETAIVALHDRGGHEQFREDYVQFEFVQQLASRCPETLAGSAIHRGMNMGGTPWTHYRFAWFEQALPGGIGEVLFHRVDARNDERGTRRYYLSTRQYAVVKGNADARAEKLSRLRAHRQAFELAVRESCCDLTFSRPAGDNQGANESEVGILFFDDAANSVTNVLERFPLVHRAFVEGLRRQS